MEDVKIINFDNWKVFDAFLRAGLEKDTTEEQVKYIMD
jgi:hypothetical protein